MNPVFPLGGAVLAAINAGLILWTATSNPAFDLLQVAVSGVAAAMLLSVGSASTAVLVGDRARLGWHVANLAAMAATFGAASTLPFAFTADMASALGTTVVWMQGGAAFVVGGVVDRLIRCARDMRFVAVSFPR